MVPHGADARQPERRSAAILAAGAGGNFGLMVVGESDGRLPWRNARHAASTTARTTLDPETRRRRPGDGVCTSPTLNAAPCAIRQISPECQQ